MTDEEIGNTYWQIANNQAGNVIGRGNDKDAVAIKAYYEQFGRPPTQQELSIARPYFDTPYGNAYVAQLRQQEENTPDKLYAKQQQQWQQGATQHHDTVKGIFSSMFGRNPSEEELNHYSTLLSSGQADPYELQQFLQTQPEYQNAQDTKFRSGLNTELQGYDQQAFSRGKEDIISRYAQMGRSTSPALDVALTDLQAKINENRGQYLAQLSASQYGGNKASAITGYQKTLDNVNSRVNTAANAPYQNYLMNTKRNNEIQDYGTQRADYMDALGKYGGGQGLGPLDYLNTALNGANTAVNAYAKRGA